MFGFQNVPDYLFQGFKRETIARLKRNLYGSKSEPKLWYDCLYQVIIELSFKSVAGHPCLCIRVTRIGNNVIIIVIGIFIDDHSQSVSHRKFNCGDYRSKRKDQQKVCLDR